MTTGLDRRSFLRSTAAAGAGFALSPVVFGNGDSAKKPAPINVAVIGLGEQGTRLIFSEVLNTKMDRAEAIRFKAVCDISPYRRILSDRRLRAYKHEVNAYESYEELLAKENGLDAAIVAVPDWMHSPITIACLKAGLHVYCESPIANNLADARKMVKTSGESGKLLQIGYQRRSDPRYIAAEEIIRKYRLLGRVKNVNAQWNRSVENYAHPLPGSRRVQVAKQTLKKYGYGSMQDLVNWRLFEKYGSGLLGGRGSGQIDVLGWFLGDVNPMSAMAIGGKDYFDGQQDENVMAIYEYQGNGGSVRAFYQVLNTTSFGIYSNYYEVFMGDEATLVISQGPRHRGKGWLIREFELSRRGLPQSWRDCQVAGHIGDLYASPNGAQRQAVFGVTATEGIIPSHYPLLNRLDGSVRTPHLKNFFDAIRDSKVKLNCPGEEGYRTAVAVLRANEAIQKGIKVKFTEADFKV